MSARMDLHKMLATAAREASFRCGHAIGPGHHGCTAACSLCVADAVLELFPDAVTEYVRLRPGWVLPAGDLDGDHVRYVLRTAPEPVEGDQCPRC